MKLLLTEKPFSSEALALARGAGPMICEHLHRGRQERKIFLKISV